MRRSTEISGLPRRSGLMEPKVCFVADYAEVITCKVHKLRLAHAAREYSFKSPPRRSRRFTIIGAIGTDILDCRARVPVVRWQMGC